MSQKSALFLMLFIGLSISCTMKISRTPSNIRQADKSLEITLLQSKTSFEIQGEGDINLINFMYTPLAQENMKSEEAAKTYGIPQESIESYLNLLGIKNKQNEFRKE